MFQRATCMFYVLKPGLEITVASLTHARADTNVYA